MGTHYRGTSREIRALDAYIKLVRASESLTTRLGGTIEAAGLTLGQFGVLEALLHLGPLCQKDLGWKLLRSGGNITTVVDNLEKRGMVKRIREKEDRRYIEVHLTGKGRRLIRSVFPRHISNLVREMAVLRPQEQAALGRLCRKLGLPSKE